MTTTQLKDQLLFTLMRVYTQRITAKMKANMPIRKTFIKHDAKINPALSSEAYECLFNPSSESYSLTTNLKRLDIGDKGYKTQE